MGGGISRLGIVLGFRCNFSCAHCSVSGKEKASLSGKEVSRIVEEISKRRIKTLLFIGGEPSLYIPLTNKILSSLSGLGDITVKVTTNGHFAFTQSQALATMAKYVKLDSVQLSYDKFHAKFLPVRNIENLYRACRDSGREFGVLLSIQSPLDLAVLATLRRIGDFPIAVQKVLPVGAARKNGVDFSFPRFDRRVLKRKCENRGKAAYICGRGFSVCCANLSFGEDFHRFAHPTLQRHFESDFYKLISTNTMGELAKKAGIAVGELKPEHSNICSLCEYVFHKYPGSGKAPGRVR